MMKKYNVEDQSSQSSSGLNCQSEQIIFSDPDVNGLHPEPSDDQYAFCDALFDAMQKWGKNE